MIGITRALPSCSRTSGTRGPYCAVSDPVPCCLRRAEQAVDMPVRLKIDIGDGAVILIGGHENQAAVAGFRMRPLGGPGLRGPGPHLGGCVVRERYLPD